jgi:hypothetical protein
MVEGPSARADGISLLGIPGHLPSVEENVTGEPHTRVAGN